MKWGPWIPLIVVGFAALGAYAIADASSLPAMPYGRTLHEVDELLTVETGSTLTIAVVRSGHSSGIVRAIDGRGANPPTGF